MRRDDFDAFSELLDGCYALLGREKALNGPAKALFFRALGTHSLEAVRAGLDAHIKDPKRGRFAPTPADVIEQIEGLGWSARCGRGVGYVLPRRRRIRNACVVG